MDDDRQAHLTFCDEETSVFDAVRNSMYTHVDLDRYEQDHVNGVANALIEDGSMHFEGDPSLYLYSLAAAPVAPATDAAPALHAGGGEASEIARLDKALDEAMRERDEAEEVGTRLAGKVGEYLDVDVGEHSSANDPRLTAIEALENAALIRRSITTPATADADGKEMSLRVALDFADNPRPHHTLQAPADTNGELYRALKVLAAAYRGAATAFTNSYREAARFRDIAARAAAGAGPTIAAEFKDWFVREWAAYEDKKISGGQIVSMAWALKGWRASKVAADAVQVEPASSCDPGDICAGCRCKYNTYAATDASPVASADEPVVEIREGWQLVYIGSGPIAPIVERHGLKIGTKLYARPPIAGADEPVELKNARIQDYAEQNILTLEEAVDELRAGELRADLVPPIASNERESALKQHRKAFIDGYGSVGNTKFHVAEGWDAAVRALLKQQNSDAGGAA
jgi:hypothetical protein